MTPPIALYIGGVKVADGSPDDDPTAPYAVDGLAVSWGRPTTVDQPDASTCSFTLHNRTDLPDPDLFGSTITLGRAVDVLAGDGVHVFLGQTTDVSMVADDDDPAGLLLLNVTCDDLLSDLANRPAASTPFPKESVAARFEHIIGAARLDTPYTVASDLAGILVRKLDVDEGSTSMVTDVLADIATSVDGVLWSTATVDGHPALQLESPAQRAPLRRLALVPPYVTIVDVSAAAGSLPVDPCVPDLEPIEFRQTMSDLVTGVSVTYYVPDPDDPTGPDLGVTITVVDPGAESPSKPWGTRRMTIDSQLTTAVDAQAVAGKLIGRLSSPSWRLNNLTVDNGSAPTLSDADMVKILGMRTRTGLPITINPLPVWAPPDSETFTGYLEGGEITSTAGVWSAALWVSLAQGYGGASARWLDLVDADTWQWQDVDPDISWSDLSGVAGPI